MEFTRSGRLRRQGKRWTGWGLVAEVGAIGWVVAARGESRGTAFLAMAMAALVVLTGVRTSRKARLPFRLRIDEYGVTLLEGRLDWARIEGIGLRYGGSSGKSAEWDNGRIPDLPDPDLFLYPAEGVTLPGRRRSYVRDRVAYLLVDCAEVDQGLPAVIEALKRYAGSRFESAPRRSRGPVGPGAAAYAAGAAPGDAGPLDAGPADAVPADAVPLDAGPADGVPVLPLPPGTLGEFGPPPWNTSPSAPSEPRTFSSPHNTGAWLLTSLAVAVAGTFLTARFVLAHDMVGGAQVVVLWPLAAGAGWYGGYRFFRRWTRPLRLRIGPDGITMRDFAATELVFGWHQVAAVTVGPRPGTTDKHPWLLLWPVPGERFSLPRTDLVDGHETYALVRLRRLRDGDQVEAVTREFAGPRYAEPA
ncbi:hypothetical protein ACFO3J_31585 [Streptomyces polygonati]|uniref:PH domain-containing protein n=1 Tax=Streptomyces polygonati TaxID=1617087 RepID=A0ABV8HVM3_9ACTN